MAVVPIIAAVVMALLHFFAGRLKFLQGTPRSRWLSIAGGISVAYVVVHLLPEIAEYQEAISETAAFASVERHAYVLVLLGLIVFYGVERWASAQRRGGGRPASATAFSFATYAIYNAIIGYLLVGREGGVVLFAAALGVHFAVNDHSLREHHGAAYHRYGRWLLSASVLAGTAVAYAVDVPKAFLGVLIAVIGGGTILNVLKEELPEERESRFTAFLLGAVGYTALLLAV
jgi:hypothetical protein